MKLCILPDLPQSDGGRAARAMTPGRPLEAVPGTTMTHDGVAMQDREDRVACLERISESTECARRRSPEPSAAGAA
jgi:hypothetical protein